MGSSKGLGTKEITGQFATGFKLADAGSWWHNIAHSFKSDQPQEVYKWLGQTPYMREWIGARKQKEPTPYSMTVINRKFDSGVVFDRDDMRRDKTGMIRRRISNLGARTAMLPEDLLTTLIEANGNAYDGTAFFADRTSLVTGGRIDNQRTLVAASGTLPTTDEMSTGILGAVSDMIGAKDDEGAPCGQGAKSFAVMVPALYLGATAGALKDQFTAAGVSNTLLSAGFQISWFVNGWSNVNTKFHVCRTDGDTMPFIFQEEEMTTLEALDDSSDYAKENDKHKYMAKRLGEAAFGEPSACVEVTVT